jgi:hypothetical protein
MNPPYLSEAEIAVVQKYFDRKNAGGSGKGLPYAGVLAGIGFLIVGVPLAYLQYTKGWSPFTIAVITTPIAIIASVMFPLLFSLAVPKYRKLVVKDPQEAGLQRQAAQHELLDYLVQQGWSAAELPTRLPPVASFPVENGFDLIAQRSNSGSIEHFVEFSCAKDNALWGMLPTSREIARKSKAVSAKYLGILLTHGIEAGEPGYVHISLKEMSTVPKVEPVFLSPEFNKRFFVETSSPQFASDMLTPGTLAMLNETCEYPRFLTEIEGLCPPFMYYIDANSVLIYCEDPNANLSTTPSEESWTPLNQFVVLYGQFNRFYQTLSNAIRS